MKRYCWIICIALLMSPSLLVAQERTELSLRDAVIGAYGELKPKPLQRFQWMPEGSGYSFMQGEGNAARLVIKNATSKTQQEITFSKLNSGVESTGYLAMRFFPSVSWISNSEFLFDYYQKIFVYNIETETTRFVMDYDSEAANADIHPDDLLLAYTLENNLFVKKQDGKVHEVTAHSDKAVVAGQAIARVEFGITKGIFWSPNGEKLAFFEKDESNIPEFPVVDYASEPTALKSVRYPLSGKETEIPKVGVFDPSTGQKHYLQIGEPKEKYLTNLTWSPDGKSIYLVELNRDQNRLELVRYDAQRGERLEVLFSEEQEKYIEPQHGPIFIPDASGDFLWYSYRDGFNHMYRYKSNGKLVGQITRGDFDIDGIVGFDEKGQTLFVTAFEPVLEKHLFKVNLKSTKMTGITKESGYHDATMSADHRFVMVQWSSPEIPARNDLYSADGTFIKTIHTAEDPLKDLMIGTSEIVTIPADDGSDLYGRLVKPSDFDPEKSYPVLVYVYGGPHVQLVNKAWLHSAGLWMHYLAEQGYLVFTLDNRGTAHRGIEFEQASFRQLGTVEIQDQLSGVEYLKSLPYADIENMAVYGWSFGGFMATSLMLRTPGVFKAAVGGGTVSDWRSYEVMYTERYMDTPEQNPEGYELSDLKEYTANLTGDLLLIHGTSDDVVTMDHSMDLLKSFIDNGKQVDYFLYPGHAHNVHGIDRVHLLEKVLNYVIEKVPSTATTDESGE